jgi:hypothetical protein
MLTRQQDDGTRIVVSDRDGLQISVSTPSGTRAQPLAHEQLPELLAREFGLDGFALGADGRLLAADASGSPAGRL